MALTKFYGCPLHQVNRNVSFKMKKHCAYCGEEKPLTKEHVWPKCMLERIDSIVAHFSVKSQKVHGADYAVNDVCEDCNNRRLSVLDNYFCSLYDIYFHKTVWSEHDTITFEYDYNLLSRSLLKIAYNTSRSGISDPKHLAKTSPYILGETQVCSRLILFLEIISPTQISGVGSTEIKSTIVPPPTYRSALMKITTPMGKLVLARLVGINSYYFHLLITKSSMSIKRKEKIKNEFIKELPGAVCLNGKNSVNIQMSERDGLSSMMPRLLNHFDEYGEFFEKKRKKTNKSVERDRS